MYNKQQYQPDTDELEYEESPPRIIGKCEFCEEELRDDAELWTDEEGNRFCSAECAMEFHGIHAIDDER